MPYTLQDVDAAEALIRELRPDARIARGDYDWSLAVADKNSRFAVILFQSGDETRPEISSKLEEVRDICFFLGEQWTADEAAKIRASGRPALKINRIQ